jgi:hypothetical protein
MTTLVDQMTQPQFQDRPGELGYYWIRWRHKWGRRWMYDVVFTGSNQYPDVRGPWGWKNVSEWPHAKFYGPLVAPEWPNQ